MNRWLKPPRVHFALGAFLAIQIALSVVLFWPRSASSGAGDRLFPAVSPDDIIELTITDDTGATLRLELGDGQWMLPDAGGYPVREESISTVLETISGLETGRLVTKTEPSHRSLQVADDDFLRRIVFELADGSSHALYLGSSPRYGLTHLRVFGQDEVYLTDALQAWDVGTSASAWVDTSYVSVPQADLVSVAVTNSQGTFEFTPVPAEAEGATTWTMTGLAEDEILNQSTVNSVVNQASSMNLSAPIGLEESRAFGLDSPNAVVKLETAEETITIAIGELDAGDANFVVKADSSPYYVHVAKWNLENLVNYGRNDFLELPPEPLSEEEAGTPAPE
jgi:hypothetical protein